MTILLAALSLLPSAPSALPVPQADPGRTDRRLVALRVVRDLDRDGIGDLCIRAQTDGRAEIAAISAAQGSVLWRADGPDGVRDGSGAPMPGALAPLGDLDRDGIGEIAALWRDTDSAGEQRGVVLAVHAGRDGRVLRAIDLSRGPAAEHATTLTATGDLDGDLLPDLIVLAPARDLFPGRISAISSASGDELWSATTSAVGDEHGTPIAPVRDVDGDGIVDHALVVGGSIEVLSGRDGRLVKRVDGSAFDAVAEDEAPPTEPAPADAPPIEPADGEPRADELADEIWTSAPSPARVPRRWVASGPLVVVGDLDGDSVLDLFVPQRMSTGNATSSALVSVGKGTLLGRRETPVWSAELGSTSFRAAGDFDGDKRIDVLCCDPGWNLPGAELTGGVDVGSVRVLAGLDGGTVREWHGGLTLARVGRFSAIAGDVDRDGANEVWMSAMDTSSRPHEVLGLASGATGAFLRWIDLGRMPVDSRP